MKNIYLISQKSDEFFPSKLRKWLIINLKKSIYNHERSLIVKKHPKIKNLWVKGEN